jgi:hypothetical protein
VSRTQVQSDATSGTQQTRKVDMKLEIVVIPVSDVAALRRATAAHGEHEKRIGKHDDNWPDWYADYILREQTGKELPS